MKDKAKLLHKRALLTCVIMLFICVVLKLFGIPWFDLNKIGIPVINEIDKIITDNNVLSFIYSFISLFINGYLICIITTKITNIKKYIIYLSPICILSIYLKLIISNNWLSFIIDALGLFIVCVVISKKKISLLYKEYIIISLLNILYQMISLFIKNIHYHMLYDVATSTIFMMDYYIMMLMTYLYVKKGGSLWEELYRLFGSFQVKKPWKTLLKNSKLCLKNKENSNDG